MPATYREDFQPIFNRTEFRIAEPENQVESKFVLALLQLCEGDVQVGNELWFKISDYKWSTAHSRCV